MRRQICAAATLLALGATTIVASAGTQTPLPGSSAALSVTPIQALIIGGGRYPVEVTVGSAANVTITVTGAGHHTTLTQSVQSGTSLLAPQLSDANGHPFPKGPYSVSISSDTSTPNTPVTTTVQVGKGSTAPRLELLPGTLRRISSHSSLTVQFSQGVAGNPTFRPTITPHVAGSWSAASPYSETFTPSGSGFAPGARLTLHDAAIWQSTGTHTRTLSVAPVAQGRIDEVLAQLGYLPLVFTPAAPAAPNITTTVPGAFTWAYHNIPVDLRHTWLHQRSIMRAGALSAFASDHGLWSTDASVLWPALVQALTHHTRNRFGYSFVRVYRSLPEYLVVWHNGAYVDREPVNTGIASRPTNHGIFPIYLRQASGTMTGTNPDGSHYNDSGIRWISYFSDGDALHQFSRGVYGYPQSLGCVEMSNASAYRVWRLTELGTLVDTQ